MILTREQIADRQNRLAVVNRTHACSCTVKMTIRLDGFNIETQCTEIMYCDLHDPRDYLDTIKATLRGCDDLTRRYRPYKDQEDSLFEHGHMLTPPCFVCGYNGAGYFQPETHSCAARHHALYKVTL